MNSAVIKRKVIPVLIMILALTAIYTAVGTKKEYLHMDEAYSFGLSNYDKVEINENKDFYGKWHDSDYYNDYLIVNDDEQGDFTPVYTNQMNDVHPPLYYFFLRLFMEEYAGTFSMWPGIILNIIIQIPTVILLYLISKRLFKSWLPAYAATFFISISMATLSSVMYIRMYDLAALFVLLTLWLHLNMMEKKKVYPYITAIGITALLGSLTHYYYLFYLAAIFTESFVGLIKRKEKKLLVAYILSIAAAAAVSLAVFPYSIVHLFFGYRGQGAMEKLTALPQFLSSIGAYLLKAEKYAFNHMAVTAAIICVCALVIVKKRKGIISFYNSKDALMLFIPTIFYFLVVAVASPYIELRYILPICPIITLLAVYLTHSLLRSILSKKAACAVLASLAVSYCLFPAVTKEEPETLYIDKGKIVSLIKNEYNLPTVYCYNTGFSRFLDDIYLFSILNKSYVAKDPIYTERTFRSIFATQDISHGVIVFINNGQNDWMILHTIQNALNLNESFQLEKLNACTVYCIK